MADTALNAMTYSDLGNLIPQKYDKKVRDDIRAREYFGKYAGAEGSQSVVIEKSDLKKEAGDRIHIETLSELFKPAITAENILTGNEEKFTINRFTVTLELYRHAVAVTHKGNTMAIIDSINRAVPKLGRYFASLYDDLAFSELLSPANATGAVLYGGTATSDATLTTTSRLSPDSLDELKLAATRRGMLPIEVRSAKGDDSVEIYLLTMDEVSWYYLQRDSTFRSVLENSLPRGYDHPLFTGAKGMYNGILLKVYPGIHMGCHRGTPQRPEVELVGNHVIGNTTLTVGSSATGYDYTKYFPQSGTFTAIIQADGSNAAETITTVACSGNNYQFTCDALGVNHLSGARIIYQGHRSQLLLTGAEALVRAWGEKDTPISDARDYGFTRGVGLMSTCGVAVIEDSAGNVPNVLRMHVYADLPNATSLSL